MKTADSLSLIGLYGREETFKKHQTAGCTEFAFGSGDWINANDGIMDSRRIVPIFVFFYPDRVEALCTHKGSRRGHTVRGGQSEHTFSPADFEKFLTENKITLAPRQSLVAVTTKLK